MGSQLITIRAATADDVPRLAELESANQLSPWSERVFRDELAETSRVYLVAVSDEVVTGFGGVIVVGEEAHVTNLLVDPEVRRKGTGRRLITELIFAAVVRGARHLTLEVRPHNQAALALYASLGLAPVGVRPGYYSGEDALIMWVHDIDSPDFLEELR